MAMSKQKKFKRALEEFVSNRYLPIAFALLIERWGEDIGNWIAEYEDTSDRILVWNLPDDYDFCSPPGECDLIFPLKSKFIETAKEMGSPYAPETIKEIYAPCPPSWVTTATFVSTEVGVRFVIGATTFTAKSVQRFPQLLLLNEKP